MGSSICTTNKNQSQQEQIFFNYAFSQDTRETPIQHQDTLSSHHKIVDHHLKDCQNKLKISNKLYKDPTMKTDPIILKSLSTGQNQVKCTFQRPHIFLNRDKQVLNRKYRIVDFGDSKNSQVQIKDPILQYFGVFLCFIADNPQILKQILLIDSNTYGIYVAQVNIASKKQFIYFDDYTLCLNRSPLFTQPIKKTYIWPCLLEKVWFKIKQITSKKIQKLEPEDVINTFMSYPTKTYQLVQKRQDNERLLQEHLYVLQKQKDKGCIVTTKMHPGHKLGISGNKYFYLIKIFKFQGKVLYYMRNPCVQQMDFRGTYSSPSTELIAIIKELTRQTIPQGNFILDEEQFIQQVQSFLIIYHSQLSQLVNQQQISISNNTETFIYTELKNNSSVSITYNQYIKNNSNNYTPLMYHVISLSDNTLVSDQSNEEGCFGVKSTHFFKNIFKNLKKGNYLIRIKKKPHTISTIQSIINDKIVITASMKVKFDYKQQNVFAQNFRSFLRAKGSKMIIQRGVKKFRQQFEHIGFWLSDLVVVYIEKRNKQKQQIRMQVNFPQLSNLECISHPQIKNQYVAIQPLKDYILIIFEKIILCEETILGKYSIQSY